MAQRLKAELFSRLRWLVPVVVLLVAWQFFSRLGVVNPVLLSSPLQSLHALYGLFETDSPGGYPVLLVHVLASLGRFLLAFTIGVAFGVTLGALMGVNRHVYRFFDPLITVAMPVPGIAWAPLFMLWLGFGAPAIVAVGALAVFFPVVHYTAIGVRGMDVTLLWAARSMGAGWKTVLLDVCLPGAAAYIFTGLRLGFAQGWRAEIAVEMIAGGLWGLGFMIMDAREYLRPSIIYGGIVLVAGVYLLMENLVLERLEKHTVEKWGTVRAVDN